MGKVRVAVLGTIGKSVLIDTNLSPRIDALEETVAQLVAGGARQHKQLLGLQIGDDHPQYTMWQATENIVAPWNFQAIPTIQGETLAEYIEEVVGGSFFDFLQDTTSVVWTYFDTAGELEANVPPEFVQDTVGDMLVDSTSIAFSYNDGDGTFTAAVIYANPSASLGLTAVNGSAATAMRSDAAPALDQGITPTWTGTHRWTDNDKVELGTGGDLAIYHDGTESQIDNLVGVLSINVDGGTSRVRVSGATSGRVMDFNSNHASGPFMTMLRSGTAFADFGNAATLFAGGDLDGVGFCTRGADNLEFGTSTTRRWVGSDDGNWKIVSGALKITDGITAPGTETGFASLYVDSADGDLKVKFGDGTVKVLATDT